MIASNLSRCDRTTNSPLAIVTEKLAVRILLVNVSVNLIFSLLFRLEYVHRYAVVAFITKAS